ncbi:3-hydroxyacyl-CoA dehydrogenase NAD-binding domain-containing protein [Vibrio cyclitrophicus]
MTSNTSTIPINLLAKSLERPENSAVCTSLTLCIECPSGNWVVEEKTSDETINRVVAYAAKTGKSPIVVNDCPGSL